jgi:catechol 2,3-dioxygenase-like lactoylglutathione lyase family enzyme
MRLDHAAFRVRDRIKTAEFFIKAFGYKIQTEFDLKFNDGTTTQCIALEPPEKVISNAPWTYANYINTNPAIEIKHEESGCQGTLGYCGPQGWHAGNPYSVSGYIAQEYHLPPEIFVSDGPDDSIVGQWVKARGGIGGIHHLAYQVNSVEKTMQEWREKGYAEFTTESPLTCPGLTQCFTKPSELTGIIYEFIERGEHGFCKENVAALMESTKDCK